VNKIIAIFIVLFCLPFYVNAQDIDIKRNVEFTKNKFLAIEPNGNSFIELSNNIKPNIILKGASDEEEKLIVSEFFKFGYVVNKIYFIYTSSPLDEKTDGVTTKNSIISNLRELRKFLAIMGADETTLEYVQNIMERIKHENSSSPNSDKLTSAMLVNLLYQKLPQFTLNSYGLSYKIYYSFGVWNFDVFKYSVYSQYFENIYNKNKTSENKSNLEYYTNELRNLIEKSNNYKISVAQLTKPAVSRNLDNLTEIATEMKSNVNATTIKRIYDYNLNVHFAVIPKPKQ